MSAVTETVIIDGTYCISTKKSPNVCRFYVDKNQKIVFLGSIDKNLFWFTKNIDIDVMNAKFIESNLCK